MKANQGKGQEAHFHQSEKKEEGVGAGIPQQFDDAGHGGRSQTGRGES